MKEKILILGGNGFIGIHLIRKLRNIGYECFSLSLNKLDEKNKEDNIHYLNADISDFSELSKVIVQNKFDYVVNLSGYIDHSKFIKWRFKCFKYTFWRIIKFIKNN